MPLQRVPVDERTVVVDADGLILGRMASKIAKLLLSGYRVIVVNAERAVVSGSYDRVIARYKKRLEWRTLANVEKTPKRPRRPDLIVRRTVRWMLPWKKPRGKAAYKRLFVYIGTPDYLRNVEMVTFKD